MQAKNRWKTPQTAERWEGEAATRLPKIKKSLHTSMEEIRLLTLGPYSLAPDNVRIGIFDIVGKMCIWN